MTYLHEACIPFPEYQAHKRSRDEGSPEAYATQFPGLFTLSRAGEDSKHYNDNVDRREDVEILKDKIPPR